MKWFFFSFLISRHSRRARNRKCSLKQDPLHPPVLLHWSSPAACWISISTTSCTAPSLQKVNAKVKLPKDNQKLYAAPSKSEVWAKQSAWAQRELRSFPTGFSSISLSFLLSILHSQCPVPLAWQSSRSCRAVGTHSSQSKGEMRVQCVGVIALIPTPVYLLLPVSGSSGFSLGNSQKCAVQSGTGTNYGQPHGHGHMCLLLEARQCHGP